MGRPGAVADQGRNQRPAGDRDQQPAEAEISGLPRAETDSLPGAETSGQPRAETDSLPGAETSGQPRAETDSLPGAVVSGAGTEAGLSSARSAPPFLARSEPSHPPVRLTRPASSHGSPTVSRVPRLPTTTAPAALVPYGKF
ncbi:hypothetical protein GCM10027203_35690 [Nonomuraea fastidiosa]